MLATHVPKHFWREVVLTATYLISYMLSRVLNFQTPYGLLLQTYPHIRFVSNLSLRIFVCAFFVHNIQQNQSKVDPKSIKCIFLGYSSNQQDYKCYSSTTKKMYNSMDVTFFEDYPFYPKTNVQGENRIENHQFWSYLDVPSHSIPGPSQVLSPAMPNFESRPAPVSSSVPSHVPSPVSSVPSHVPSPVSSVPSHVPNPVPSVPSPVPSFAPVSVQEKQKEILVYSRRQKAQKEVENRILSQQCQEADMSSSPLGNHTSSDSHNSFCPEVSNDRDQPIALRKEKRSCTLRPISKFVSYKGLSTRYKAFSTALTVYLKYTGGPKST